MNDLVSNPTRCLLVQPRFSSHSFWNYSEVCELVGARYPAAPLGLMTVAALMPQHWTFRLVDENVRPLREAEIGWSDIVLTSGMLPQQRGILSVIERAHAWDKPVVVGGPDATGQPHLYADADFLVLGEGEVTVPRFLEDLRAGVASGEYRAAGHADMADAVIPRFDLIDFGDYLHVGIQFCRGCPYNCEFCDIIELFGRRPRAKSPDQVVAELQRLYDLGYRGHVDFVDDNFIGNKRKVLEVLEAVGAWSQRHDYPFFFSTEASINLANEPELLRMMRANDFRYVFVGIETPDAEVLDRTQKRQNNLVSPVDAVRTLNEHGMIVNAGFILGFDGEKDGTAAGMIRVIEQTGICMAMVGTLTALPNTQLARRLVVEGRMYGGGGMALTAADEIDQTTSGLNFITERPRAAILRDHATVLRGVYHPKSYYARILKTALQVKPAYRHRRTRAANLQLVRGFIKASLRAGFNRRTGLRYWRTLVHVLARNPRAADIVVNMAAMYLHFARQSRFVVGMIERKIADLERRGETEHNRAMMAPRPPAWARTAPSSRHGTRADSRP